MKGIAVLGSTGSIGRTSLKVIENNPGKYKAVALAAGNNIKLLEAQIRSFQPLIVSVREREAAERLRKRLTGLPFMPAVCCGLEGIARLLQTAEVEMVISAISGAAGLLPTYEAIKAGKDIALANKETMVMAGDLVVSAAARQGVTILPVDSEHSAVLQSLQGHSREDIQRIILTASGGPFRKMSLEEMKGVTPAQTLRHPNWDMGPKVTVDSATLMNKGLEAIEARWFFNLSMDRIDILIHHQSVIHSMVEYRDGSVIAQLGVPDMTIPISYALSFPAHLETHLPRLALDKVGTLTFEKPDTKRFKCLRLALEAAREGGSMPTVMNGANEIAVHAFLDHRISFLDMPDLIERTMEAHVVRPVGSIEEIMVVDGWARDLATRFLNEAFS
jgi:1-deoxy-D-xylulose-5-phosphate reductoisomerase